MTQVYPNYVATMIWVWHEYDPYMPRVKLKYALAMAQVCTNYFPSMP